MILGRSVIAMLRWAHLDLEDVATADATVVRAIMAQKDILRFDF